MQSLDRQAYCRKEKSLGVLVTNFLKLYNKDDIQLFELDEAVTKLGVERRRIYDVVNILESIGVIDKRGMNLYVWKGFGEEEGMREKFGIDPCVTKSEMVLYEKGRGEEESLKLTPDDLENTSSSKLENKKERALWLLTRSFVKLFQCSDDNLITLDDATKAMLNIVSQDPMYMRTKVRRLYDIANVFTSINLIEKTCIPGTKKPAYRWLGAKGIPECRSLAARDCIEPKKRVFGTEITNLNTKRNKTESSEENTSNVKEEEQCDLKPDVAGSVAPGDTSKKNNNGRLGYLETLSSIHRPQYCNNELTGLLGHYNEAWKFWFAEFGRK